MTSRVAMYFLGGTISMSSGDGTAVEPTLGADELIAAVPGLAPLQVELTGETVAREQSGSLTLDHLLDVLRRARHAEADGFVLVQGTDTLEESAYLLDLLWDDDRPFVVTGAMRNPTMAGADGAANMLAAVTSAAAPLARGRGALVVFADEIHEARRVTKGDTSSVATFVSPDAGPTGRVLEGHVHFFHPASRRPALALPQTVAAEVPVVNVSLGQSDRALRAVAADADAVVIAGLGAGHVPGWWADSISEIAARLPVVMTSRTVSGPALTRTYGAVGAEVDLQQRGVIMGGYLSPQRARLVVSAVLGAGGTATDVAREIHARGEFI